jgi:EAL domain-containing protein (putative c-di-GMP-specific phosphodiesterase class I)
MAVPLLQQLAAGGLAGIQPGGQGPAPDSGFCAVSWELEWRPLPDASIQRVLLSTSPFTIGRHSDNSLSLSNPTVSGRHAELSCVQHVLFVRDLNSTNGTFVNGERITGSAGLRHADTLQFGTAVFTVCERRERTTGATVAADAAGYALAHLQFDKLLSDPAVAPYFQPIVRLGDQERIGYEVLARSRLAGLESPELMFQVATERSREPELSSVLRFEGLHLGRALPAEMQFYLNTHPSELAWPGLAGSLRALRGQHPDARVVLEIHESAATSPHRLIELRACLQELNIQLAYDDFGAGRSRLMELAEVPPDVLKFDMHLIRGLDQASPERRNVVKTLVDLVRDLKVVPLAEGVETAEEAEACRDIGFELAQGFFFGRPAAARLWANSSGG